MQWPRGHATSSASDGKADRAPGSSTAGGLIGVRLSQWAATPSLPGHKNSAASLFAFPHQQQLYYCCYMYTVILWIPGPDLTVLLREGEARDGQGMIFKVVLVPTWV